MLSVVKEAHRGSREWVNRGLISFGVSARPTWDLKGKCVCVWVGEGGGMETFYIPGTMFIHSVNIYKVLLYSCTMCTQHIPSHLIFTTNLWVRVYYSSLTDERTEAQGDKISCSRSHILWDRIPTQTFSGISCISHATCYQDLCCYDELGLYLYWKTTAWLGTHIWLLTKAGQADLG